MTWTQLERAVQSLDALGWALVLALWHTTLLAMGVWALFRTRLAAAPLRRHALALAALAMALLLTGTTWWGLRFAPRLTAPSMQAATANERVDNAVSPNPGGARPPVSSPAGRAGGTVFVAASVGTRTVVPWLAGVWCLAMVLLILRLVGSFLLVTWITKRAVPVESGRLVDAVRGLATRVGLQRRIAVAESADLTAPATTGWLRPTLLVPKDLEQSLPADQLDPVIVHELEHVRFGDRWLAIVQATAEAVFFFAPGSRWLARQAREAREQQCDDAAIRVCGKREAYARALGMLATRTTGAWWAAALGQQAPSLVDRIRRIVKGETMPVMTRAQMVTLALAAVATVASGTLVLALSLDHVRPADARGRGATVASAVGAAAGQARVPTAHARIQPGAPVSIIRATGDGTYALTQARLRNVSERRLESVTFLAVVEHPARVGPAILVPSDPLPVSLEPGEAGDVSLALLPIADVLELKQSRGYRAQVFLGLVRVTFADGGTWAITPPEGAATIAAVFHFESRPWNVSRALLADSDQPGRPGASCFDDRGAEYSPGALVRIREGGTAQCIDGRWIGQETATADAAPWILVSVTQPGMPRAQLKIPSGPDSDGGKIVVPAKPLTAAASPTAAEFILRAWVEGDGVRVVVNAVGHGDADIAERHVSSFVLSAGESHEVVETERLGAAHLVVAARQPDSDR